MTINRERFEAWYLAEFWEGSNCGRAMLKKEHCGGYTYAKPQELWKVWQAAQPGDGEPVAWITRPLRGSSKGKAVMCQADHTPNLELWEKPFPVYAAPPAAAHGDEAVRKDFEEWAIKVLGDNPNWRESGDCELAWQSWQSKNLPIDPPTKKDAERYRWFRSNCEDGDLCIARSDGFSLRSVSGDDPDRYIDAAMRAQGDGEVQ